MTARPTPEETAAKRRAALEKARAVRAAKKQGEQLQRPTAFEDWAAETRKEVETPESRMMAKLEEMQRALEAQKAAMESQNNEKLDFLLSALERRGIKIEELFQVPPKEVTVEVPQDSPQDGYWPVPAEFGGSTPPPPPPDQLRPGMIIGDPTKPTARMVEMTKADNATLPKKTFTPMPIPGLVWPVVDDEGRQKIRMIVNGLECWLTCGIPNTTSVMFADAYEDAYKGWLAAERFKREGPQNAPWGIGTPGNPAWMFNPAAYFHMDEDGRSIVPGATPFAPR